jgi:hypothetical protein
MPNREASRVLNFLRVIDLDILVGRLVFCLKSQAVANRVHKAKVDATLLDRNEARHSTFGFHCSELLLQCKVAANRD